MPNHYTTCLIGYAPYYEDREDLKETFTKNEYSFDADTFNAVYGKRNLCQIVRPMPEEIRGTTVGSKGYSSDDERGWLGWARKYWGTKWGTYDTRAHHLGGDSSPVLIEFQSAWRPPNGEVLMLICEHFESLGFSKMVIVGCEPGSASVEVLYHTVW